MPKTIGYAAKHSISDLRPMSIERRDPRANDVVIGIEFCGVCHSDVHQVKNEWKNTLYPCMPGHEIVGRVLEVGGSVTRHKVGDRVGVGCMVDACLECENCRAGLEQFCTEGFLATYNGNQRTPTEETHTYGGYSERIVVREEFVLRIPESLDSASAAPLLCAGVTTYSPLKHWKVGKGSKVGVVGLGGLGQMATKIARALGAEVTIISEHDQKRDAALKLGAKDFVVSKDKQDMKGDGGTLDVILSTIPTTHDANKYMPLLKRDGTYVVVGCLLPLALPLNMASMLLDRKSLGTTLIGSLAETQEVLDFCAQHGIASDVKVIPIDQVNDAYDSVDKGEVPYRFVIDMASLAGKKEDESLAAKVGL